MLCSYNTKGEVDLSHYINTHSQNFSSLKGFMHFKSASKQTLYKLKS